MFALRLAANQMCAQREHAPVQLLLNSMACPCGRLAELTARGVHALNDLQKVDPATVSKGYKIDRASVYHARAE
jgi:hypothetical protein